MKMMTKLDLHETCWKAKKLAISSRSALGIEGDKERVRGDAQAMLDYLWALGFRPSIDGSFQPEPNGSA